MPKYLLLFAIIVISCAALYAWAQAPRTAQEFYDRGKLRHKQGNREGAIADFSRAIEIMSQVQQDSGSGRDDRRDKRNPETKIYSFDKVTVVDPRAAAIFAYRCLVRYELGDLEEALADCNEAIARNPRTMEAYHNRGNIRYAKKDFDGAISDYNRVIELDSKNSDAYSNRGSMRYYKGDIDGAIADFDHAIECNPRFAVAYCNRGNIHRDKKNFDKAIADFEKALEINPGLALAYHNLGLVWCDKNDLERAVSAFTEAIKIDSNMARAFANRGLALLRQGQDVEAEKDFERYRQLTHTEDPQLDQRIRAVKEWRAQNP